MPVKQYFVTLLKLTALGIAGIGCAAILYTIVSLVASPESRRRALRLLGLERLAAVFGPDRFSQGPASPGSLPKGFQDLLIVERDNEAIYTWVLTCVGIDSSDVAPSSIHYEMMLPTERLLGYRTYTDVSSDENKNKKLEQVEHALIQLNKNIAEQRLSLMSRVRSSYLFLEMTTLISIAIGMATTLLVSISSTEFGRGDGHSQRLIRILAIVFPAVGTAAAAIIGFYSPQAEWGQASRTLASETQLHDQMALAVWAIKCPKNADEESAKPLAASLVDWSKRYSDIQAISNASTTPSGTGEGGSNQPGGSGNPPGGNVNPPGTSQAVLPPRP